MKVTEFILAYLRLDNNHPTSPEKIISSMPRPSVGARSCSVSGPYLLVKFEYRILLQEYVN